MQEHRIQGLFLAGAVLGLILALFETAFALFGDAAHRATFVSLAVAAAGQGACSLLIWLALSGRMARPSA
jgi:hypothetical protein